MSKQEPSNDNVRTFLREIGRYPLLTHSQEVVYGKQVHELMFLLEAKEALIKNLGREPTLSEWAEYVRMNPTEFHSALQQGKQAKRRMVEANLRLVVLIALNYQKRGLELLDLLQEGAMGLQRAVEKFDPCKGYRFSTYSCYWIRQAITRAIGEKSRTIRLPIHINEKMNKIKKASRELSQQTGRTPTVSELAAQLKMKPKQVRQCLELMQKPVSLNLRVGDNQDLELVDQLPDTRATEVDSALSVNIESLLKELTPQQRDILSLRFGLRDGQELTLVEVGALLNLSKERVRQLEKLALLQLREHSEIAEILRDYFQ